MKLPNNVSPNQPISAKDFNAILDALRSLQLRGGPGVTVQQTSGGTTVSVRQVRESLGGIVDITHPFKVTDSTASGVAKITVKSGTVSDIEPTNVATPLTLSAAGTWRVYLDCTLSTAGTITAATVSVTNSSQPSDTNTHAYITLAIVTVVTDESENNSVSAITQGATHSLRFFACNRVVDGGTVAERGSYNFWGF